MTDDQMKAEREAFEKWAKSEGLLTELYQGQYLSERTEDFWCAWEARALLAAAAPAEQQPKVPRIGGDLLRAAIEQVEGALELCEPEDQEAFKEIKQALYAQPAAPAEQQPKVPAFIVRRAMQALEEAKNPKGMHTNGKCLATIEASTLEGLLRYAQVAQPAAPAVPDDHLLALARMHLSYEYDDTDALKYAHAVLALAVRGKP